VIPTHSALHSCTLLTICGVRTTYVWSGNISNNIAISPAISEGDGTNRFIVTTAWDWGPLASWDGGAHWPGWNCADCEGPG
jgi:hypothetical protein